MKFVADLHVHSKYSRATAKNLDLEHLYMAAQLKGITVVATGDCTHPEWFQEIKVKLKPAEEGLFRLDPELSGPCDQQVPPTCRRSVRFMLVSEISNIYKKDERTRKNHNLVFMPDLETAKGFNERLDAIGNISSDGRPILGLDARDLLEIVLETSPQAFLIPAHIWTPWFSLLGSKSGFDSVEACFGDLSEHIFALETGLSSDPTMNRRVSKLDDYTLVSNSDAHSPMKLGREANIFNTELAYGAILEAIRRGQPNHFLGTFEFYPEEGKYHVDGHRKCGVRLLPRETITHRGICPVCQKGLTLGVLHRVEELADRLNEAPKEPPVPHHNLIPMEDILAEILQVGSKTKKVAAAYRQLLQKNGSEFDMLHWLDIDSIDPCGIPLLQEALKRMRAKQVIFKPGYDGEFGRVHIFDPEEREQLQGQRRLFDITAGETIRTKYVPREKPPDKKKKKRQRSTKSPPSNHTNKPSVSLGSMVQDESLSMPIQLNPQQEAAVLHGSTPLIIVAGPGTGKTRTLTQRIAHLIAEKGVAAKNILAVTFTKKAAQEMRTRLRVAMEQNVDLPLVATFHALSQHLLSVKEDGHQPTIIDENQQLSVLSHAIRLASAKGISMELSKKSILDKIVRCKQMIRGPSNAGHGEAQDPFGFIYAAYQDLLRIQGLLDYEDLIFRLVQHLEEEEAFAEKQRRRFQYVFVDEYQDLNHGQYRIVRALSPLGENLCVIGDPDQAIYGFRGGDHRYFEKFIEDYPAARVIHLSRNYRSTETILESSSQLIQQCHINITGGVLERTYSTIEGAKTIRLSECASERSEAVFIGRTIEDMVGGSGFHVLDFGKIDSDISRRERGFSDFAVLYRTNEQGRIIRQTLHNAGIPCQLAGRNHLFHTRAVSVLLSLWRVQAGIGAYHDFELSATALRAGIGKGTHRLFRDWAFQKELTLTEAMAHALRFPIPRLNRPRQQKICDLINRLQLLKAQTENWPLDKGLTHMAQASIIDAIVEEDPASRLAFQKLIELSKGLDIEPAKWLVSLNLDSDTDTIDTQAEKVSLMSMHAAKGLEFPVVFIAGCEDDFIPYRRSQDLGASSASEAENEERRLFYVAMTRAKEILFLCHARKRRVFGKQLERKVSPLFLDIEEKLIRKVVPENVGEKIPKQKQLSLF